MIRLLFIDYTEDGFSRYASSLVQALKKTGQEIETTGLFMHQNSIKNTGCFDHLKCAKDDKYNPDTILSRYNPHAIIVFGHRFFDYMFTIEAHRKSIPVYNFQHGLYSETQGISSLTGHNLIQIIKKKREKITLYLLCVFYINKCSLLKTVLMLHSLIYQKNMYCAINHKFKDQCNANYSIIFGSSWKHFYEDYYQETKTSFFIAGYPELEGRTVNAKKLFANNKPTICYLAQTTVEDGLVSEQVFHTFLTALKELLCDYNLVLKLHPRSNVKLYKCLCDIPDSVSVWKEKDFPETDYYIGHESTIIARALYITPKTLVCRLSPERVSPFEKYTGFTCNNIDTFEESIKTMIAAPETESTSSAIESFAFRNPSGAIRSAADFILNNLREHFPNQ